MTRILAAALSLALTASAALISTAAGVEAKTLGIVALIAVLAYLVVLSLPTGWEQTFERNERIER